MKAHIQQQTNGKELVLETENLQEALELNETVRGHGFRHEFTGNTMTVFVPIRGTPGRKPGTTNGNGKAHAVPVKKRSFVMTPARVKALARARAARAAALK